MKAPAPGIDLYWIPLGAGGNGFVRFGGRAYEAVKSRLQRRPALDLYHTALVVGLPGEQWAVETAWPSPNADTASRGVVLEGAVWSEHLARLRPFRYEVRCWRDGVIPDLAAAVGGPRRISGDEATARKLLDLTSEVPRLIWGRDELGTGEMWNSNSVVAWLLAGSGVPVEDQLPPPGGRAPGWGAGIVAARRG